MNNRFITNPFVIYPITYLLVVAVYSLRWSYPYPDLSGSLYCFLGLTSLVMLFLGYVFHKKRYFTYRPINYNSGLMVKLLIGSYILLAAELLYSRQIPFISVLNGNQLAALGFGLPYVHVFFVNMLSFISLYIFHGLLSSSKKREKIKLIFYLILSFLPGIIIYNRAMLLTTLLGFFFMYMMYCKNIVKKMLVLLVLGLGVLYLFGLMGDIRTDPPGQKHIMLEISAASDSFKESSIPPEFFWGYVYIATPLGNLQHDIDIGEHKQVNAKNMMSYIIAELFPGVISKRAADFLGIEPIEYNLVLNHLNVSSVFAASYLWLGWLGMVLTFLFHIFFILMTLFLVPRSSPYFVTAVVIINSVLFLNLFSNMFNHMGIIPQLVFCILFSLKYFARELHRTVNKMKLSN